MRTATYVADRHASFEMIFNFRDLGGYLAGQGRRVRWSRLYRSDAMHRLSDNDLDTLQGLGLRTVIDVRTHVEVAEHGWFPVDRHRVDHHHLPVIARPWEDDDRLPLPEPGTDAAFLTDRYLDMLAEGGPSFAAIAGVLARPDAYPVAFHCAVGKDRTGVIAAVLLSVLGVADDLIIHDYTLSALGMARLEDWLVANSPEGAEQFGRQPAAWLASPPAAMVGFLGRLRDAHGSAEGYLLDEGVAPASIAALRANLLH